MTTDFGADAYRRFLSGDERGFDDILKEYHDSLIFFIHGIVKQYETAEDLAADTFMELLVHKHRYGFKSSFKTYLFSIARHKAIDYVRKNARHAAVSIDDEHAPELADFYSMEDEILQTEERRRIRALIGTLPQDYAMYLHLFYFEELSMEEIGRILKKNKKQMANIAYRAKKALESAMRGEGDR